jgi:molybdopterin-binding protein
MPRKQQGWITFQSSEEERKILEKYSQECQRTKTDILRELVRSLPKKPPATAKPLPENTQKSHPIVAEAIQFSARNQIKGIVRQIVWGAVNVEVTVEIADGVQLISIITKTSAEKLGITEGIEIYAVIKSNNVMLARSSS